MGWWWPVECWALPPCWPCSRAMTAPKGLRHILPMEQKIASRLEQQHLGGAQAVISNKAAPMANGAIVPQTPLCSWCRGETCVWVGMRALRCSPAGGEWWMCCSWHKVEPVPAWGPPVPASPPPTFSQTPHYIFSIFIFLEKYINCSYKMCLNKWNGASRCTKTA